MGISTCSGAISLSKELENESTKFYQELTQRYEKDKDLLLSFVKENGKYVTQIERAYYGVITDAIEGCFAFESQSRGLSVQDNPTQGDELLRCLERGIAYGGEDSKILSSGCGAVQAPDGRCSEIFYIGRKKEKRTNT